MSEVRINAPCKPGFDPARPVLCTPCGCALLGISTGESTSARLRRTEAELGSALGALGRLEKDYDALVERVLDTETERNILRIQLAGVVEFASAFDPETRVSYYPARQDVGACVLCGQPIVRGHWVEARHDSTTRPEWAHAAGVCPDKETS